MSDDGERADRSGQDGDELFHNQVPGVEFLSFDSGAKEALRVPEEDRGKPAFARDGLRRGERRTPNVEYAGWQQARIYI